MKNIPETMYESVRKLIHYLCNKFQKRFGGEITDYESHANETFMNAFMNYDPSQGSFSKRISFLIWNRLLDLKRDTKTEIQFRDFDSEYNIVYSEKEQSFDLEEFIEKLTAESKHVVRLALKVKDKRSVIKRLLETYEWDSETIVDSFQEIREVLYA